MHIRTPAVAAILVAALFTSVPAALAQTTLLDGRTFVADGGEKGKPADELGDVLTFSNGQFHSSACDKYGYGKGSYKATKVGDAIEWEAETTSEKYGKNIWKGTVKGADIDGTFVHQRKGWLLNPNPDPIDHWFKGKAKS
jgi:hypothetical protein